MNSCQPNRIWIVFSPLQLQMESSLHQDIKPNGKECLGTTRRMERLRHQSGKGSPTAWENERTAACERIQLPDKTLHFPLSNHATIISIPRAAMCSDREDLLLWSLHGNGTAAKTQQWQREEKGRRLMALCIQSSSSFSLTVDAHKVQTLCPNAPQRWTRCTIKLLLWSTQSVQYFCQKKWCKTNHFCGVL